MKNELFLNQLPSMLWHCWLGYMKSIRPVKNWVMCSAGMAICLEQGTNDLHIVQLMPLPIRSSLASLKSRMVLPYWLTQVVLKRGR